MNSEVEIKVVDNYKEHEQHRISENGKIIPYWRNMKTCSTCFSKHTEIVKQSKINTEWVKGGRMIESNLSRNPNHPEGL